MQSTIVGTGSPVILLHEWLGDHRNWLSMLSNLSRVNLSFHCLDFPGYGKSADIAPVPSIDELSYRILEYADTHSTPSFFLVGHSMGALVAHHLSNLHPERISKTVLFCPVPPSGFEATTEGIAALTSVTRDKGALREAILARGGHLETENWVSEKTELAWSSSKPEVKAAYLEMFLAPTPSQQKLRKNGTARVIVGTFDLPFYQKASVEQVLGGYYNEVLVESLANSGHYPMLQEPKSAADSLMRFLSD